MSFHYQAFGIPIISEIALPALLPLDTPQPENPVYVQLGQIPDIDTDGFVHADTNAFCTPTQMIYTVTGKIKFYISGGNSIIIEPTTSNYSANLIYFYSNCLAAILYQRNLIPFHVSGVFTAENKVALFAAPSGTGKSTMAVKLQELGYKPFTDDTAVLYIEDGKCYAQASYPMIRVWQNTIGEQTLLNENDKQRLYEHDEWDKFGFSFHEQFTTKPAEVQHIIFLKAEGQTMQIKPIKKIEAFKQLADNVYRCHWVPALKKNVQQFQLISNILHVVPFVSATRPEHTNSHKEFPLIIKKILN